VKPVKLSPFIFFIIISWIYVPVLRAQFYVAEHTLIHLEKDLVSQEFDNYINQSISGQSKIIFNSGQKQMLYGSSQDTGLPGLLVADGYLEVFAAFVIKGDVSLVSSHISLNRPLLIHGKLLYDNYSTVQGVDLIIKEIDIKSGSSVPLSATQGFKVQQSALSEQEWHTLTKISEMQTAKPVLYYKEQLKDFQQSRNSLPPPKTICPDTIGI
jgi:hypothetical protein